MKLINQKANSVIDYFKPYEKLASYSRGFRIHWHQSNLRIEKDKTDCESVKAKVVELKDTPNDVIFEKTPMGYDASKKNNLIIKVAYKNLVYPNELGASGSFYFSFNGVDDNLKRISKSSQRILLEDIQKGTEFIIPINTGEYLNVLQMGYAPPVDTNDSCLFTLIFEFYFEEITE